MNRSRSTKSWLRLTLLVIVVAAACYLSCGFGRLWAEWRQANQNVPTQPATVVDFDRITDTMPLAGEWSFAELDWNLRSSLVRPDRVAEQLDELSTNADISATVELPDVSDELLELAQNLSIRPVVRGNNQIYSLDRSDLTARLVVRSIAGRAKVVALAAAFPIGNDKWQLLECAPRDTAANHAEGQSHLLPLPAGARRDGGRFAENGQPLLEFISLQSTEDDLVFLWRAAGWEVRPSDLGRPDQFGYLCARGDEVVYAWSADPLDAIGNLMLVHTPDASDTKP